VTARTGATIPSDTDPPESYRRVLCIPGTPEWLALINGALWVLTQSWYWNADTGDVEAVTTRAQQMYFEFQDQNGGCDVTADIGDIKLHASTNVPPLWLMCDGSDVAKADYTLLYAEIGDAWGTATNPTTHFKLPDYRDRFPMGYGMGGGRSLATFGGVENVALSLAQIPPHSHNLTSGVGVVPGGTYLDSAAGPWVGLGAGTTVSQGGGQQHTNMPPYATLAILIYAGE